jgi:phosphoserine phosphatase
MLLIAITTSCSDDNTAVNNTPMKLEKLNWSAKNYQVLNNFIAEYGKTSSSYNSAAKPYVVLDFDNTCVMFDVEEALMRYQVTNLQFKLAKEEFASLLKDDINGITQLSAKFNNVALSSINADLLEDYKYLYDNYIASTGAMTLEEIKLTDQYLDFRAKIPFLYSGYCSTDGIGADYGYPWVLYLLAGYTIDEVKALAVEAIDYESANTITSVTWQSPAGYTTQSGVLSSSFISGIRAIPEMINLITTFESSGIDVFIISASYKPVIEVIAGYPKYGFNVLSDRVIAMELEVSEGGKILPEYKQGWIKTYGQGKNDAIVSEIKTKLGRNYDPIFSAGDSDGDYEMSTGFPGMKLTLLWNRLKGGNFGKLCTQAVAEADSTSPRYILQGRNENTGLAMPQSESILFGETEPRLLKSK